MRRLVILSTFLASLLTSACAAGPRGVAPAGHAVVVNARLAEINAAERLLENPMIRGDNRAELMLRLADLYFQQGRDLYLDEMERAFNNQCACPKDGF